MQPQRSRLASWRWASLAIASGALFACGGAKPTGPQASMSDCPMAVLGTTVAAIDTPEGIAIAFDTTGDVAELRRRATAMAARHDRMGAMANMKMVSSTAREEDADGGARIVMAPKDVADVQALRDHVRGHVQKMTPGKCAMMGSEG
jgi:hypothetical protein